MLHIQVPASRTYSNPATVAALLRTNGYQAVRRAGLVPPDVLRAVIDAHRTGVTADRKRAILDVAVPSMPWKALKFARRHGVRALRKADEHPHDVRLVGGLMSVWRHGYDPAVIGPGFGWDVAVRLARLDRRQMDVLAMSVGLDLQAADAAEAVALAARERRDPDTPGGRWQTANAISTRAMRRACQLFGVTRAEIKSGSREQRIVIPRMFYFHWAKRLGDANGRVLSFPMLGRACGDCDHTTALHGFNTWPDKREAARALIAQLRAQRGGA
ncbi:helix-turn-helix domain-containing protein [Hoeflea sp.]|uniref:helix-turn-helix domain-containing protein n=1 Tax=Hoeflea sp. TaxID=1940281 RepID=UPI003B52B00C